MLSLRLIGLQQEAYTSLNWEARLTTRAVRATPLTVVVAPAQRLDWDVEDYGGQSVGKSTRMLKLSRVFAVVKGLFGALTGRSGSFALLVDCHFEVDEDFQIVDLDTVRTASCTRKHQMRGPLFELTSSSEPWWVGLACDLG